MVYSALNCTCSMHSRIALNSQMLHTVIRFLTACLRHAQRAKPRLAIDEVLKCKDESGGRKAYGRRGTESKKGHYELAIEKVIGMEFDNSIVFYS